MKIGILTYHSVYNFGANLQAYSTYQYIHNSGFDPIIIDYLPLELEAGYNAGNPAEQSKAHKDFIKEQFILSERCINISEVARIIQSHSIDAIVIGSDAVLQHRGFLSRIYLTKKGVKILPRRSNTIFPNPFWGCFLGKLKKKVPVYIMSASSQNARYRLINPLLLVRMSSILKKMDYISVRDDWTRKMIKYISFSKINPVITPDPVFAFNQNNSIIQSKEEILRKYNIPENFVLISFKHNIVSREWLKALATFLESKGITPITLTMPGGIIKDYELQNIISPPLSPIDWYHLIKYSKGYIGENMHPIIVCLHNSVPFYSFDSYGIIRLKYFINEKSSKIYHILESADLLQNRISSIGKFFNPPSPEMVGKQLLEFDSEKCAKFSADQLSRYNSMMNTILKHK